jgi:hypothetical protein
MLWNIYLGSVLFLVFDVIFNVYHFSKEENKFDMYDIKSLLIAFGLCLIPIINTVFAVYIIICMLKYQFMGDEE